MESGTNNTKLPSFELCCEFLEILLLLCANLGIMIRSMFVLIGKSKKQRFYN